MKLYSMMLATLLVVGTFARAADIYPVAILPFEERGVGAKGYGEKVSDIMFASLVANPDLILVDRVDLQKTLTEHELNLSGMVSPDQAIKVGQLTGARIFISGSIIDADKTVYLVAKVIGTETSRVLGEKVTGKSSDDIGPLVEALAEKVGKLIAEKSGELVAKTVPMEDRLAALNKSLGDKVRPSVSVKILERHVGQATIDPAAETELMIFCKETGFTVIDPTADKGPDLLIQGEGFSEFAMRRGNLVSVKARVEIKVLDAATKEVVATDRQTSVEVDLTEQIAGKKALEKASAIIAERLLPQLVK